MPFPTGLVEPQECDPSTLWPGRRLQGGPNGREFREKKKGGVSSSAGVSKVWVRTAGRSQIASREARAPLQGRRPAGHGAKASAAPLDLETPCHGSLADPSLSRSGRRRSILHPLLLVLSMPSSSHRGLLPWIQTKSASLPSFIHRNGGGGGVGDRRVDTASRNPVMPSPGVRLARRGHAESFS